MSTLHRAVSGVLRLALLLVLTSGLASPALAITRDRVMAKARAFAFHPWGCKAANLSATCAAGYESAYFVGDQLGVAYDWGGFVSLREFDAHIAQGYGAGSFPSDGVLSCTTGLDCSGFVSQCWDTGTKYGTWTLVDISREITQAELLPGDVLNDAGTHVVLFSHLLGNGDPVFYEAGGFNTHMDVYGGWASVSGFVPRRYDDIEGTTATDQTGTTEQPIEITSYPFVDSRDTNAAVSDVFDACAEAAGTDESGPEYIYTLTLSQPGALTVLVADDVGVDIDVHLYEALNTSDCVARAHTTFTETVDCGTYFVVADTFVEGGVDQAGPFSLTVNFTPSGGSCGAGPNSYQPGGALGGPCADANGDLALLCNPNLGGQICIVSPPDSFCSIYCESSADCGVFPGGCCRESSSTPGLKFCLTADFCGAPDAGAPDAAAPDTATPDSSIAADSATAADAARPDGAQADRPITADAGAADLVAADIAASTDSASIGGADAGPAGGDGDDGTEEVGCECRGPGSGAAPLLVLPALALLIPLRRRRRDKAGTHVI